MADVVEILIVAKNLTKPAFAEARAGMTALEATTSRFSKVAGGAALATAGIAVAAVKMASSFQSKMALLTTQANVAKSEMGELSKGVLDLAGQVGFSPNSLAEALFHVKSAFGSQGITAKKSLEITKVAAEGAAIGHAKLVDVTNALTAAIASGIPGTETAAKAMGVLNATVGVGDMTMQNLADALGTGMLATVKGFGLSIIDVSAALATFGDSNQRGAMAGTQLRMSVQALAHPVATGAKELARLGLETNTLAKDMQKGGLKLALSDLIDHMNKAGVAANQQGQVITTIFGKRAGVGLNILVDQFDRLMGKYPEAIAGIKHFGRSWLDTQAQTAQKMKELQASFDVFMVLLGQKLIPVFKVLLDFILKHRHAFGLLLGAALALTAALGAYWVITKAAAAATWAFKDSQIALQAGMQMSRIRFAALHTILFGMNSASRISAAGMFVWSKAVTIAGAIATNFRTIVAPFVMIFNAIGQSTLTARGIILLNSGLTALTAGLTRVKEAAIAAKVWLSLNWMNYTPVALMQRAVLSLTMAWYRVKEAVIAARVWLLVNWMNLRPLYAQNAVLLMLVKSWGLLVEGLIRAERIWIIFSDFTATRAMLALNGALTMLAGTWGKVRNAAISAAIWLSFNWAKANPVYLLNSALLGLVVGLGRAKNAAIAARVWLDLNWVRIAPLALLTRGLTALKEGFIALRAAAITSSGGLGILRAMMISLSAVSRASLVVLALVAIAAAVARISGAFRQAGPDVDKLTTSFGEMAVTGATSGEALRLFGKDLDGLYGSVRNITDPTLLDKIQQWTVKIATASFVDSTPHKEAMARIKAIDQGLANLVQGGHAEQAAIVLGYITKAYSQNGKSAQELTSHLGKYKQALASSKMEQDITADSAGRFGRAAINVQLALAKQENAANALRDSLQALDAIFQEAFNDQTAMERSIGAVGDALKQNGKSLDVHTKAGQNNRDVVSAIAAQTDKYVQSLTKEHASQKKINDVYKEGHDALVKGILTLSKSTDATYKNRKAAEDFADTLLRVPPIVPVYIDAKTRKAVDDLNTVRQLLLMTKSKTLTVSALTAGAEKTLRTLGFRVTHMQDGTVKIQVLDGSARAKAKALERYLKSLSATIPVSAYYVGGKLPGAGTVIAPKRAFGGLITGPGSDTSDEIPAMLSNNEFVMSARSVRKYGRRFMEAINSGQLPTFAQGGLTSAEKTARREAMGQFDISFFGKMAGYRHTPFENALGAANSLSELVSALNHWRSVIKAATSGAEESRLLRHLTDTARGLIKHEKALEKVNAALEKAKDKLSSLKDAAAQLSDSVRSGIISSGNIVGMGKVDNTFTTGQIVQDMTKNRDQAREFAAALATLKRRGLNAQSLSEIAQAGISGGGLETARALLAGSAGDIKQINALEKQFMQSAKEAGKTTSDAMYKSSIAAAAKVVHGLEKHQHALERALEKAARAIERALKNVFRKHASGGAAGGLSMINEMGAEMVHLPDGSIVYPAGQSSRMASSARGAQQMRVVLEIQGGDHELVTALRKMIRVRGGNVQTVLGRT